MKEILLRMDNKSYSIDSDCVLEIVPLVQMEPAPGQSEYIAGSMRYRGQMLPVLDLCKLLLGRTHQSKFSTRILIVQLKTQNIGLIVESLTDLNSGDTTQAEKIDPESLTVFCL